MVSVAADCGADYVPFLEIVQTDTATISKVKRHGIPLLYMQPVVIRVVIVYITVIGIVARGQIPPKVFVVCIWVVFYF